MGGEEGEGREGRGGDREESRKEKELTRSKMRCVGVYH